MYTCSLILTYCHNQRLAESARTVLFDRVGLIPGEVAGRQQAVVLEAPDPDAARELHEWAAALPGVEHAEVVFVTWDERAHEVAHGEPGS